MANQKDMYTLWGHFKELRERVLAAAKSYSILKRSVATGYHSGDLKHFPSSFSALIWRSWVQTL